MSIEWDDYGRSDCGRARTINQDALWISRSPGMIRGWAVADGMGGYRDGDVASIRLVEALDRIGPAASIERFGEEIQAAVQQVNSGLIEFAGEHRGGVVGSTLVVFLADRDGHGLCIWAGDSRLYRLRDGELVQLTTDHSQVQGLLDYGIITEQEAEHHPAANIVTRAVGIDKTLNLEQRPVDVVDGDVYVLCSDGLNKELDTAEIKSALSAGNAQQMTDRLITAALDRGGRDNITVICARARSDLDETMKMVRQ